MSQSNYVKLWYLRRCEVLCSRIWIILDRQGWWSFWEVTNRWMTGWPMISWCFYIYIHIYLLYLCMIHICKYICMYVPSHCNFLHIVQWVKGEFSTSEFSQSYGAICIFNPSAVRQCGWVQTIDFETCSFGYGLQSGTQKLRWLRTKKRVSCSMSVGLFSHFDLAGGFKYMLVPVR